MSCLKKLSQVAEPLENQASNQKVVGSILGCAKLSCVLGQGTSPYLPQGKCPCTYRKSLTYCKWLMRMNDTEQLCYLPNMQDTYV